jgi:HK97 gp10 family phage protein
VMSGAFNNWAALANALEPACEEAVTTTAKAGKGHVEEHIKANGQVRTGRMLGSVYASTPQGSDYHGGEQMLPEEKPTSKTEAVIGVAAEYGVYNELGTVHMSGKPFFSPGLEQTKDDLDKALEGVAKKLEEVAK